MADGDAFWAQRARADAPRISPRRSAAGAPLWRLSVKSTAAARGSRRRAADRVGRRAALARRRRAQPIRRGCAPGRRSNGGHATLFRARDKSAGAFHPLPAALHGAAPAAQGDVRSRRHPQPRPALPGRSERPTCRPRSPISSATRPKATRPTRSCARCVHCGFCTATCPTYQLLGDELDGPRGRIYLIKQVLEGGDGHARRRSCTSTAASPAAAARRPARPASSTGGCSTSAGTSSSERVARSPPQRAQRWLMRARAPGAAAVRRRARRSAASLKPLLPARICGRRSPSPVRRASGRRRGTRARCWCSTAACRARWRPASTRRWRACSTASASR